MALHQALGLAHRSKRRSLKTLLQTSASSWQQGLWPGLHQQACCAQGALQQLGFSANSQGCSEAKEATDALVRVRVCSPVDLGPHCMHGLALRPQKATLTSTAACIAIPTGTGRSWP